ncbi:hypothetical protein FGG08_002851 [Glutinoglossum americanum]|uniref:Uncharacterized protein n=1 Tax=Glutinoglossum americanum TaxID=1670608 RepID=A0A9P8I8W3_9PEZI|nr:hypothetical protein FGG08_002851 [Glutinoglossum americanum]
MIRLRTSQVGLSPADVAYAIRRIVLQRRTLRAAESAAALALQNARIESILSNFPDEVPIPLPPTCEYDSRDESIICEEPVVHGHRDFWDSIVTEAGPIVNDDIGGGDGDGVTSYAQNISGLADESSTSLHDLCREGEVNQGVDYEAIDMTGVCDKLKTGGDDTPSRLGTPDFGIKEQGGAFDGACDGAGGGSEFCSPSISVSSLRCRQRDGSDGKGAGSGDGDPSSSEFEEDVLSGSEMSPQLSKLGDSALLYQRIKTVTAPEEASSLTLHHSFSTQLNFDGASESSLDHFSPSKSSIPSPPFNVVLSSPLSVSVGTQTHPRGIAQLSPSTAQCLGEATMGLPMWRASDYEVPSPQRVRRYRPRTSTYSFEESEPSSSQGYTETRAPLAQVVREGSDSTTQITEWTAPLANGDEALTEDDDQSFRRSSVATGSITGARQRNSEYAGAGPVRLPEMGFVFPTREGSRSSSVSHGPDRSPIQYARGSPVLAVPPPSPVPRAFDNFARLPDPMFPSQRIQVFNDNRSASASHFRHPRRASVLLRDPTRMLHRSDANPQELERLVMGAGSETERERRGRELALPAHWINNARTARQEFDEWIGMNGERRGRTAGRGNEISEEH